MSFTGEEQTLRRTRVSYGEYRFWYIAPRYGTGPDDRWTLLASPLPAEDNPASAYEDGQYATISDARAAREIAEALDDGTHDDEGEF